VPEATAAVLERLVALWGLAALTREAGDFLEDGYLSGEQVGGLGLEDRVAHGTGVTWFTWWTAMGVHAGCRRSCHAAGATGVQAIAGRWLATAECSAGGERACHCDAL